MNVSNRLAFNNLENSLKSFAQSKFTLKKNFLKPVCIGNIYKIENSMVPRKALSSYHNNNRK